MSIGKKRYSMLALSVVFALSDWIGIDVLYRLGWLHLVQVCLIPEASYASLSGSDIPISGVYWLALEAWASSWNTSPETGKSSSDTLA